MSRLRALAWPGYLTAALLVLFPLIDLLVTVTPLRPGTVSWRFGATGLFSRVLVTPLLGLLMMSALALLLEQRRVLRAIAALGALTALLLTALIGLFVLDAVQMRAQVQPAVLRSFDVAALTALAKYAAGLLTVAATTIATWRTSRPLRHSTRRGGTGGPDLLVAGRAPVQETSAPHP